MKTYPMKLVTVVCEALARVPLLSLLHSQGVHGYTLFPVEGTGTKGERPADIEEFANIQVEVIVPPPVAEALTEKLYREFLPHYAAIIYLTDVQVLRPEKF
jgi:nitrogen regulatory protein PII